MKTQTTFPLTHFRWNEHDPNGHHFLATYAALMAETPSLYKIIDKEYDKNPHVYYQEMKKSPLANHYHVKSASIKREIYAKKLIGIMLYGYKHNQDLVQWGWTIAVKKWTSLYRIIQKHEVIGNEAFVDCSDYIKKQEKRNHYSATASSDIEKAEEFMIIQFTYEKTTISEPFLKMSILCHLFMKLEGKEPEKESYFEETDRIHGLMMTVESEHGRKVNKSAVEQTTIDMLAQMKKDLFKQNEFDKPYLIKETDNRGMTSVTLEDDAIHFSDLYQMMNMAKYFREIELPSVFHYYSKKELEKRIEEVLYALDDEEETQMDFKTIIHSVFFYLVICQLFDTLSDMKELYFKDSVEHHLLKEQENAERIYTLEEQVAQLQRENQQLKQEVAGHSKKVKKQQREQEEELTKIKKKLTKKEIENKDLKQEIEELPFYREYYYYHQQEEEHVVDESLNEQNVEVMKQHNLFVIGGKDNWINNLREIVNVPVIRYDQKNVDLNIFKQADMVFFNTRYLNHGLFYKVINELRKEKIPFGFINKKGVNRSITEMVEQIQRQ